MKEKEVKETEEVKETKEVDETEAVETETKEDDALEALKKENEELKQEVEKLKDTMLRDRAELENFKRRSNEERAKERKYRHSDILTKLLDVIDNFDRSLACENYESVEKFREGVEKISKQFNEVLASFDLKEVEALGCEFDPNFHQAVMTDSDDTKKDNEVTMVLQKGYMYKDRVLRPTMVKVNQK